MNLTRKVTQLVLATAVIGGLVLAAVPAVLAGGGLRNCVDVTGQRRSTASAAGRTCGPTAPSTA